MLHLEHELGDNGCTKIQRVLWGSPRPRAWNYPMAKARAMAMGGLPKYNHYKEISGWNDTKMTRGSQLLCQFGGADSDG